MEDRADDATRAQLEGLKERLERILLTNIEPWWRQHTVDRTHGGFTLNHDANGTLLGPADKMIVTQARVTWFYSRLYASPVYSKAEHLELATHGYTFLRDRMWDKTNGGFVWSVGGGAPVQGEGDGQPKDLYGQAFGLFALSQYYLATNNEEAIRMARELFKLLLEKTHDTQNGGFFEAPTHDWRGDRSNFAGEIQRTTPKTVNTHMHLLEALTTYYQATHDTRVPPLLQEILHILTAKAIDPSGAIVEFFDWDWAYEKQGSVVLFGHLNELAWLTVAQCEVLDIPPDTYIELYRKLWGLSTTYGLDTQSGGFNYNTTLADDKPPVADHKVWWVQAESLNAAIKLWRVLGGSTDPPTDTHAHTHTDTHAHTHTDTHTHTHGGDDQLSVFENLLSYMENNLVDWERGEWHEERKGGVVGGGKANGWKGPYHDGRSMLLCIEEIQKHLT